MAKQKEESEKAVNYYVVSRFRDIRNFEISFEAGEDVTGVFDAERLAALIEGGQVAKHETKVDKD